MSFLPGLTQGADNRKSLSGHIGYSRISAPQSGVKLLEDIFQRVSAAPQIALAKGQLKPQAQEVFQPTVEGRLNQGLAIRPKQTGKNALMPSPSLQLIASANSPGSAGKPVGQGVVAYRAGEPSQSEIWMGNAFQSQSRVPLTQNQAASQSPGIWESPQFNQQNNKQLSNGLLASNNAPVAAPTLPREMGSAEEPVVVAEKEPGRRQLRSRAQQSPMDLATASGKLYDLSRRLEEAQKLPSPPPSISGGSSSFSFADNGKVGEKISYDRKSTAVAQCQCPPPSAVRAQRLPPVVNDGLALDERRQNASSGSFAKHKALVQSSSSRLDSALKGAGLEDAEKKRGFFQERDGFCENRSQSNERQPRKESSMLADKDVIALLPPNVVTGIPLVRLGISQSQASSALQAIGNMKQQKVNNWTVLSWQRPQAKGSTALQLYIRHGLLDAMRIFEPSLIAADFGVTLGDSLSTVKEKFGEPAFILGEPSPGAGQNYIYPISQVAFQLARPAPDQSPRVVSVLIFNVK